jgi:hypothetical protein
MKRDSVRWIAVAVAVLGLAALSLILGTYLLPPRAVAERRGTLAPWVLTWGMVWLSVLSAVTLAGFLIATSLGRVGRSD